MDCNICKRNLSKNNRYKDLKICIMCFDNHNDDHNPYTDDMDCLTWCLKCKRVYFVKDYKVLICFDTKYPLLCSNCI